MRVLLQAGLCVSLVASVAAAQAAPPAKPPKLSFAEAATASVTKLEDSWATALVRRDHSTFERLLAPKFVYTEDTTTMDRAAVLSGMFTDTVTEAHNEGVEVHVFTGVAVATGWLVVTGHGKEGAFERRYRYTDTWIPRSGSWQIVAAQDHLTTVKK